MDMASALELFGQYELGVEQTLIMSQPHKTMTQPLDPPSREDWQNHKMVIISLYIGQNMPLRQLVPYMDSCYSFKATGRMYKQRFTDWGVFKYPRAAERRQPQPESGLEMPSARDIKASISVETVSENMSYRASPTVSDASTVDIPASSSFGSCPHAASCTHRQCIRSFLFDLALRSQESFETPSSYMSVADSTALTSLDPVEEVLGHVQRFSLSWLDPEDSSHDHQIVDAAAQAKRLTSNIVGHCSHRSSPKQCERCTWSEFSFGLAMLEEGYNDLAFTSFHLGCRLAHLLLSSPSKLFIRNLIMAFGTHRWEQFESLRHQLLNYLAQMAAEVLGDEHSITIILRHCSQGNVLQQSAERALEIMIKVAEASSSPAHPDVLIIKRSLSVVLRRQKSYDKSEEILLDAINDSETINGRHAKETRRCLRRLGHLFMEQCRWEDAGAVYQRILDSAPRKSEFRDSWIPDEISVYTYQHLARMYSDMGDLANSRYWLAQELIAAIKRWGTQGEYTTECLQLACKEIPAGSLGSVIEQYPEILHQAHTSPAIAMEKISTQGSAPPAAPYSQGIRAAGFIFVSGQIPADESGKLVEGSITDLTRQCCKNVEAILNAGGSSIDKVVRVGVFLADMEYFGEMNAEYEKWFAHKPARACVAVRELPKSAKVEIEAIALA
ncbi:hypothetical protein DV737_g2485, partial [Chaetothyriales sp. CBS 132003]